MGAYPPEYGLIPFTLLSHPSKLPKFSQLFDYGVNIAKTAITISHLMK